MWHIKRENLFYGLTTLYIINQVFSESQMIDLPGMKLVLAAMRYGMLLFAVLLWYLSGKTYSKPRLAGLMCLLAIAGVNLLMFDGGLSFIPIVLLIVASEKCSCEKLFKCSILTLTVSHIFVMLLAAIGVLEDAVELRYIGEYENSILSGAYFRHTMGFQVHNQVALAFFVIYMLYIAYRREKIRWYESVALMALNGVIFVLFGSRIVFLLAIGGCMVYYAAKLFTKYIRIKGKPPFFYLAYPVCCVFSFAASMMYSPSSSLSVKLDMILNNRIRLGKEALDFYGIGLFGAGQFAGTYNSTVLANNTVDNGYIALFLQNGLIIGLLVVGIWTYLTYRAEKQGNIFLTIALVLLAVENLVNYHLGSYKLLPFFCLLMNRRDPFWGGASVEETKKFRRSPKRRIKLKLHHFSMTQKKHKTEHITGGYPKEAWTDDLVYRSNRRTVSAGYQKENGRYTNFITQ